MTNIHLPHPHLPHLRGEKEQEQQRNLAPPESKDPETTSVASANSIKKCNFPALKRIRCHCPNEEEHNKQQERTHDEQESDRKHMFGFIHRNHNVTVEEAKSRDTDAEREEEERLEQVRHRGMKELDDAAVEVDVQSWRRRVEDEKRGADSKHDLLEKQISGEKGRESVMKRYWEKLH